MSNAYAAEMSRAAEIRVDIQTALTATGIGFARVVRGCVTIRTGQNTWRVGQHSASINPGGLDFNLQSATDEIYWISTGSR